MITNLQERAPAIFATSPSEHLSERYRFVSTQEYLQAMESNGWLVASARQAKVRKGSPEHAKHFITLRHRDHGAARADLGSITPQISFVNSHNGTSRVTFMLGLFRLVCSNGLIVQQGESYSQSFAHTRSAKEAADILTEDFFRQADSIVQTASDWADIALTFDQQMQLARTARDIRFGQDSTVDPLDLLRARRPADEGSNLWLTFNRLQENIMQGGMRYNGMRRRSRPVSNIGHEVIYNTQLWKAADGIAADF